MLLKRIVLDKVVRMWDILSVWYDPRLGKIVGEGFALYERIVVFEAVCSRITEKLQR